MREENRCIFNSTEKGTCVIMKKYDSHTHTNNSLDGVQSIDELCLSAIEKGVSGITVSDHADIHTYVESNSYERIRASVKETEAAKERYKGRLEVFKSVELGDMCKSAEATKELAGICDYDVLLGSVHFTAYEDINEYYSGVSFDESVPMEKINGFLREYFTLVRNMIETCDIDVVCHLTCPLRYIVLKYGRNVDVSSFYPQIEDILKQIIEKDLALEVNTSGFSEKGDSKSLLMPSEDILKIYFDLGGKKITLGSDAHVAERVANGFDDVAEILKKIGFTSYCHFEKRKAVEVSL